MKLKKKLWYLTFLTVGATVMTAVPFVTSSCKDGTKNDKNINEAKPKEETNSSDAENGGKNAATKVGVDNTSQSVVEKDKVAEGLQSKQTKDATTKLAANGKSVYSKLRR